MRRLLGRYLYTILVVVAVPAGARAQAEEVGDFAADRFRPAMDRSGILEVEWAEPERELYDYDLQLWVNYARRPLRALIDDGQGRRAAGDLVGNRLGLNLVASMFVLEDLQVAIDVPLVAYQNRSLDELEGVLAPGDFSAAGIGAIRISPKFTLLHEAKSLIGLGALASVTLPTAAPGESYLGDDGFTVAGEVLASRSLGPLRVAGNVGVVIRGGQEFLNTDVSNDFTYRLGARYDLEALVDKPVDVSSMIRGSFRLAEPFDSARESPLELLIGGRYRTPEAVDVGVAFGVGLTSGAATPAFRALLTASFAPRAAPAAPAPEPPPLPEPEPTPVDSDGDGILDPDDSCPDSPEDKDNYEDTDGCPDPDNDGDGIPDTDDPCANDAEDMDAFEDSDGCPDPDNDNDGVGDSEDGCPNDAEDIDQFEDGDGCPELDNDLDGIADTADQCPNESEVINGVDDTDGCPDEGASRIKLTSDKIEILEKVLFATGSAVLNEQSYPLLEQVAAVMANTTKITKLEVQGHTDSSGSAGYNQSLSQRRAEAVMAFIVSKGIAGERMTAKGYGEDVPITSNETSAGREANRRVEFVILEVDGRPIQPSDIEPEADATE
ncbi:MAG: OmpA family protein [Myxococcota bacterium]